MSAQGRGQYRVVALVGSNGKVKEKYFSPTHYGGGADARRGQLNWMKFK